MAQMQLQRYEQQSGKRGGSAGDHQKEWTPLNQQIRVYHRQLSGPSRIGQILSSSELKPVKRG